MEVGQVRHNHWWLNFFPATILLFLPLYYWRFKVLGQPTNIIEIAVVIFALIVLFFSKTKNIGKEYAWPVLLIIIGSIIGLSVSIDKQVALGIIKGWIIIPVIFGWATLQISNKEVWRYVVWALFINISFVATYAILQRLGLTPIFSYQGQEVQQYIAQGRAFGFFESPNFLAMYLAPLTVLTMGQLISRNFKFGHYSLLLLPTLAILLSQSRSGLIALVVGIIIELTFLARATHKQTRTAIIFVSSFLVVATLAVSVRSVSDAQHILIWKEALLIGFHHALTGIGPGQFQHYFAANHNNTAIYYQTIPYALHPHNIFLAFWLYTGLIGIIGFVWLLVKFFIDAYRSKFSFATVTIGAMVAILVQGMFDTTYFKNDLAIIFWLLLAILISQKTREIQ